MSQNCNVDTFTFIIIVYNKSQTNGTRLDMRETQGWHALI
jgi:hypothetical protein